MVANNPRDEAERRFLLMLADKPLPELCLNRVSYERAVAAGYVALDGVMVRLTQEGLDRLDELNDR